MNVKGESSIRSSDLTNKQISYPGGLGILESGGWRMEGEMETFKTFLVPKVPWDGPKKMTEYLS